MSALPVHEDQVTVCGDQVMAEIKVALERMDVTSDTRVMVKRVDNSLVLTLVGDESRAADFQKAMEESRRRYAECFRALAK